MIEILNGPLAPDEGSAVSLAIAAANGSFGSMAEKMHIHVISVIQIGDKWQATIKVELEPALKKVEEGKEDQKEDEEDKDDLEEVEELEEEAQPEKPKAEHAPEVHAEPHPHEIPPQEHGMPFYSFDVNTDMAGDINSTALFELNLDRIEPPTVHVYMLDEDAGRYYDPSYYIDHPDYYFHFIDRGSLMEAVEKIHPDLDFYESVHPEVSRFIEDERARQIEVQNELERKRNLEKVKTLTQDLTEDF